MRTKAPQGRLAQTRGFVQEDEPPIRHGCEARLATKPASVALEGRGRGQRCSYFLRADYFCRHRFAKAFAFAQNGTNIVFYLPRSPLGKGGTPGEVSTMLVLSAGKLILPASFREGLRLRPKWRVQTVHRTECFLFASLIARQRENTRRGFPMSQPSTGRIAPSPPALCYIKDFATCGLRPEAARPMNAGFCLRNNRGNRCCRGQPRSYKTSFHWTLASLLEKGLSENFFNKSFVYSKNRRDFSRNYALRKMSAAIALLFRRGLI